MALLRRARFCGWKIGTRTACPVLIDNLSTERLDHIWSEISLINYAAHKDVHKDAECQGAVSNEQAPKRRASKIKMRSRPQTLA